MHPAPLSPPENISRLRVGVFGGAFDPVHNGHVAIARAAVSAFSLDLILVMPASVSPFKQGRLAASGSDRLAMLRLALADVPRAEVSDFEIRRGGVSYTVETVRALRAAHPGWDVWFIMGMDSLNTLHLWREAQALVTLCTFATFFRPGETPPPPDGLVPGFSPAVSRRLLAHVAAGPLVDASSSAVRSFVAQKRPIGYLVPAAVAEYISGHGLYQTK